MAAHEDFVLDYQVGQRITVVLETAAFAGAVNWRKSGERRIKLRMEDGTVRSVCYGGILADYLTAETPAEQPPVSARNELLSDQPPLRRAYLEVCAAEYEWEFDPQSLREQVRLSPNIEQKRLIVALTDSLIDAEQADDYKTMDQIVSAGLSLLEKASDSLALRRWSVRLRCCRRIMRRRKICCMVSRCIPKRFYAAWMMDSSDKMAEDGACHLLYERKKIPEVVEMYVRLAEKAGDLSVFGSYVENEGDANPELVARCFAYLMVCAGQDPVDEGEPLSSEKNRAKMARIFEQCYPNPVPCQLEQMESEEDETDESCSDPVTFNSEQLADNAGWEQQPAKTRTDICGTIFSYKPEQKIGFIRAEDTDWFFHVNHIADEQLGQMLEEDPLGQYIVLFDVGYNSRGACAVNVHLKDPEHPREKPDPALEVEHHGIITRYYPFYSNGQITEGDTSYNFRLAFVTDPTLKNYCEIWQNIVQYQLPVVFRLRKLKDGKLVATDIRLEHPVDEQNMGAEPAAGLAEQKPEAAEGEVPAEPGENLPAEAVPAESEMPLGVHES